MNQKRQIFISILVITTILGASFVWSRNLSDTQADQGDQISQTANQSTEQSSDQPSDQLTLNNQVKNIDKIPVVVSFYPLYEFVKQTGGDLVSVTNITPAGVEPHDFEPSSQQIAQIQNAKIFVFNGGGIDPWAEKIAPELQTKGLKVLNMSDLLKADLIQASESDHEHENAEKSEPHPDFDPHIWLDPVLAQKQIQQIKQVLIQVDAKNVVIFENNANNYTQNLIALDNSYKSLLSGCDQKTAVTSHNAFGYMAKRYNFEIVSVSGLSPDVEPSLQDLAKTIELVKAKKIKYIAFETLVSPKISQTIAAETGAATIVLNPIEGLTQDEIDQGGDYISVMQANLNNLRTILECK